MSNLNQIVCIDRYFPKSSNPIFVWGQVNKLFIGCEGKPRRLETALIVCLKICEGGIRNSLGAFSKKLASKNLVFAKFHPGKRFITKVFVCKVTQFFFIHAKEREIMKHLLYSKEIIFHTQKGYHKIFGTIWKRRTFVHFHAFSPFQVRQHRCPIPWLIIIFWLKAASNNICRYCHALKLDNYEVFVRFGEVPLNWTFFDQTNETLHQTCRDSHNYCLILFISFRGLILMIIQFPN